MPSTSGLFAHFRNVGTWPSAEGVPYPVENAAVHHVFNGGWVWVLKFNNGITSAGVAANETRAKSLRLGEGRAGWDCLMDQLPSLAKQFSGSTPINDFVFARTLSFSTGDIVGKRWALLPSAAGFVDPLLSTGFPLTLLGISAWQPSCWALGQVRLSCRVSTQDACRVGSGFPLGGCALCEHG